ncbi:MAG: hypothetical protein V4712_10580 [Pseudomonadota bacterium]
MLVVHAGPHKTATTFIQNNLTAAREDLAGLGWDYLREGTDGGSAHHSIAHNPRPYVDVASPERARLAKAGAVATAAGRSVVLSAEGFCRWGPAKLKHMASIFKKDRLDFVYAVRDPFDVFYSYWAEEVKQGHVGSFANRFAEHFNDPSESRLLNPLVDLTPLLKLDRVRIRVVPFNLLKARKIDIYSHFCDQALGLPDMAPKSALARNEALPIELTEFLRLLTVIKADGKRHIGFDFRLRFMNGTTPSERAEIVNVMKEEVGDRMQVVRLNGSSFTKQRIEKQLKLKLAGLWTLDPGTDSIYNADSAEYRYFNEFDLWLSPPIRKLAEDILARLAD